MLALSACGTFSDDETSGAGQNVESTSGALVGTSWTNLKLESGWSNYWGTGNTPAVALLPNGIVLFKGALKASSTAGQIAFYLPAAFQPIGAHSGAMNLRLVLSGGNGGTLTYRLNDFAVTVGEDGQTGVGPHARTLTSLDGVSFDRRIDGAGVLHPTQASGWISVYPYREDGSQGAFVQMVDNFVRFAGLVTNMDPNNTNGYLFTLPSTYWPNATVAMPIDLAGNGAQQTWGQLTVYSNGDVYAGPNPFAADSFTSLENASFAYDPGNTGGSALTFAGSGWHSYSSARPARVRNVNGVIRFQGAVSGGTTAIFATLPAGWRPSKTIFLTAAANGPVPARIYIDTAGNVGVDSVPLGVASQFLSLDGVSFGT
jgi:hypothetical protein